MIQSDFGLFPVSQEGKEHQLLFNLHKESLWTIDLYRVTIQIRVEFWDQIIHEYDINCMKW